MSEEKTTNSQVTDSVTQANTKVVGETPAMAMGNQPQANAQEADTPGKSTTTTSTQTGMTAQAATTMGVATLEQIDTSAAAEQRIREAEENG